MPRDKNSRQKVQILMKTTVLCPSSSVTLWWDNTKRIRANKSLGLQLGRLDFYFLIETKVRVRLIENKNQKQIYRIIILILFVWFLSQFRCKQVTRKTFLKLFFALATVFLGAFCHKNNVIF